jgi:hypothetical protein
MREGPEKKRVGVSYTPWNGGPVSRPFGTQETDMVLRNNARSLAAAWFFALSAFPLAGSASVQLFDWAVNVDNTFASAFAGDDPAAVAGVDAGGFDTAQGLGTLSVTISGAGSHLFDAFFDHQFDVSDNTFFNETASVSGSAATGQSWEIDEPGFVSGDIFINTQLSQLDNAIGVSPFGDTIFPDDVSMAMGWDFVLGIDQTAIITLLISDLPLLTTDDLTLIHSDPDSSESIHFTGNLDIRTNAPPAVREPATMALLCLGLVTVFRMRTRASRPRTAGPLPSL